MSVLLKLTFGWVAAKLMPALSHQKKFVAGYKDSGATKNLGGILPKSRGKSPYGRIIEV